ncbi:hypothetical protein GKODMF_14595 [Candidatus Electrothrix gigas]
MKKITLLFMIFTLLGCSTDTDTDKVSESAPASAVTLSADPASSTAGSTTTDTATVTVTEPAQPHSFPVRCSYFHHSRKQCNPELDQ